jgi:hypothetical protein
MDFQHPALNDAVADLTDMRQASAQVGGADPVEALRDIDCAPRTVQDSAAQVAAGADQERDAAGLFARGTATADRSWRGAAADAYLVEAGDVGADRRKRLEAAEETAAAGRRIAEGLDALARSAAGHASSIAANADPSVQLILHPASLRGGAPLTDPLVRELWQRRQVEAAERVRQACSDIQDAVRRNVDQIADLGGALGGLTEPVPSTPAVV